MHNIFRRFLTLSSIAFLSVNAFAEEENQMTLKAHAYECIQKLSIFSSPEYDPKNTMRTKFENDTLTLYYDPAHVAEVDNLLNKWKNDCGDLFNPDKYASKFFTANPLSELVTEIVKKQQKEEMKAIGNDSLSRIQKEKEETLGTYSFIFRYGTLQSIEITPKKGKSFQYRYNGTNVFWDRTDIVHKFEYQNKTLWNKDTLYVTSGYYEPQGAYLIPKKQTIAKSDYPELNESFTHGTFEFSPERLNLMPRGSLTRTWAVQFEATFGLYFPYFTSDLAEDVGVDPDSTRMIGPLNLGFDWDVLIGLIHCNPQSERCFGFGGGYSAVLYSGNSTEERNRQGQMESEFHMKVPHSVKMYGEFYLKNKTNLGIKQAVAFPIKEDMKYLLSKTSLVTKGNHFMAELGIGISPIQCVPAPYINFGYSFQTPPF